MDTGHEQLITDLKELLAEAENFEFHDFKNEKYALPKVTLVLQLTRLITKVKEGKYDQ